jgi:hypothetical protein
MCICSFAARKVVSRSASRVVSQPVRIPGNPYVFDIPETPIARRESVAAGGSGSP